ncbi:MAG: hypothetical protein ACWGQW_05295 [bacterium]
MDRPDECPRCGGEMDTLLFMGEIPEFYVCKGECKTAFDVDNMAPLATVFGGDDEQPREAG